MVLNVVGNFSDAMFIQRTRLARHWSIESNGFRTAFVGADPIKLNVAVAPEFL